MLTGFFQGLPDFLPILCCYFTLPENETVDLTYTKTETEMKKDVLIIGGGVAGLSAGIYGQLNGYNTEILEMHAQVVNGSCMP